MRHWHGQPLPTLAWGSCPGCHGLSWAPPVQLHHFYLLSSPHQVTWHPSSLALRSVRELYQIHPTTQQGPRRVCLSVSQLTCHLQGMHNFPSPPQLPLRLSLSHTLILILIVKCPLPLPPPLLVFLLGEIKTQYFLTNVKDKWGNTGTTICKSPGIGYTNKTLFSLFLLHSWRKGIYIFFHGQVANCMTSLAFYNFFFPCKELRLSFINLILTDWLVQ